MYLQLFGYNRNLISSYCTPRDRHKKISLNNHKPIPRSIETTSSCTYLFVHISIRAHIYSCIYLFVHISIRARIHCLLCCIQMFVHFSKSPINEAWLMQQRVWVLIFFGSLATATGKSFSSKSSFIKISKLNYCLNFLFWLRMKTEKFLFPKLKMWLYLRYFLVFFCA